MPLYEYQCDENGHRFEVIQKYSDPLIEVCPTCGGHVHKLISSPAIQFKGTGWYITDYARKDSGGKGSDQSDSPSKDPASKDPASKDASSKDAASTSEKEGSAKKTESTSPTSETASKPAAKDSST